MGVLGRRGRTRTTRRAHLVQRLARLKGAAPAVKHAKDGAGLQGEEAGAQHRGWLATRCWRGQRVPAVPPGRAGRPPALQPAPPPLTVLPVPERPRRMSDCGGRGWRSMISCRVGGGADGMARELGRRKVSRGACMQCTLAHPNTPSHSLPPPHPSTPPHRPHTAHTAAPHRPLTVSSGDRRNWKSTSACASFVITGSLGGGSRAVAVGWVGGAAGWWRQRSRSRAPEAADAAPGCSHPPHPPACSMPSSRGWNLMTV